MSILSKHDVIRFEISIDDAKFMYVLNGQDDLGSIDLDILLPESHFLVEVFCEIFAGTVLQSQVDVVRGLEGEVEVDDEGVVDLLEDVHLRNHKLSLFAEDNLFLLEHFEGIQFLVFEALDEEDLSEGTFSQQLYEPEIFVLE